MTKIEIRPIDILNLPDLAVPCLRSGSLNGRATVPAHCAEEMTRRKLAFFHEHRASGAGAHVAYLDDRPVGVLEYCPIESAPVPVMGEDLFVILCLQISAPSAGEEIEKELVATALDAWSARKGVVVLGEKKDWSRHGFEPVWSDFWPDGRDLTLWMLTFWDAEAPEPVPLSVKGVNGASGVLVQLFDPGYCPGAGYVLDRVERIAGELDSRVKVERVDCGRRDHVLEYGITSGVAVNGRIQTWLPPHPPPTDEEIREKIEVYL